MAQQCSVSVVRISAALCLVAVLCAHSDSVFLRYQVLTEDRQSEAVYLEISPLFLQARNKHKLCQFVSQFVHA